MPARLPRKVPLINGPIAQRHACDLAAKPSKFHNDVQVQVNMLSLVLFQSEITTKLLFCNQRWLLTFGDRVNQSHGSARLNGFYGDHIACAGVRHSGFSICELPGHLDGGNAITFAHVLAFDKRSCRWHDIQEINQKLPQRSFYTTRMQLYYNKLFRCRQHEYSICNSRLVIELIRPTFCPGTNCAIATLWLGSRLCGPQNPPPGWNDGRAVS